jgi:hypothetical protein
LLSPHVYVDNRFADRPPSERDFDYVDLLHVESIADDTVDDSRHLDENTTKRDESAR